MSAKSNETVVIKKYANRRLYNTSTSTYVTLENLAQMVKEGTEFNVYDAKTNEDITRAVLTQIIVEEEGKSGQNLLPISFMRKLIGFYGDNMQWVVPKYLDHSMQSLSKNQDQIQDYIKTTFGGIFPFGTTLEQMSKQNLAMFERTMRMFTPYGANGETAPESAEDATEVMEEQSVATPASSSSQSSSVPSSSESSSSKSTSPSVLPSSSSTYSASSTAAVNSASVKQSKAEAQEQAEEAAFTPSVSSGSHASVSSIKRVSPIATPETTKALAQSASGTGEDVQNKIAALQRQLSELAKNKA
jgi:polyhydroxyalkanoate synthesis repressor PhaR